MNLSAYSIKDLQHCLQILQQIKSLQISLREGMVIIEQHVAAQQASVRPAVVKRQAPSPRPCPQCDGYMTIAVVPADEGVRVWGCRECRFSVAEEVKQ